MIRVEGQRIIRTTIEKVFQLVSRLETHPRVTGLWLTADLLERRANGVTVQYRGYLAGMPVESVQQAVLQPPHRVEFRQTRGGFKVFRGSYVLKPVDGDTELALTVEADVGIPLITEMAARRVLQAYVEQSLNKFKLSAERELPRPMRRVQPMAATPVPTLPPPEPPSPPSPRAQEAAVSSQPAQGRKRRRRRRRRRGSGEARRGHGPSESGGGGSTA